MLLKWEATQIRPGEKLSVKRSILMFVVHFSKHDFSLKTLEGSLRRKGESFEVLHRLLFVSKVISRTRLKSNFYHEPLEV